MQDQRAMLTPVTGGGKLAVDHVFTSGRWMLGWDPGGHSWDLRVCSLMDLLMLSYRALRRMTEIKVVLNGVILLDFGSRCA